MAKPGAGAWREVLRIDAGQEDAGHLRDCVEEGRGLRRAAAIKRPGNANPTHAPRQGDVGEPAFFVEIAIARRDDPGLESRQKDMRELETLGFTCRRVPSRTCRTTASFKGRGLAGPCPRQHQDRAPMGRRGDLSLRQRRSAIVCRTSLRQIRRVPETRRRRQGWGRRRPPPIRYKPHRPCRFGSSRRRGTPRRRRRDDRPLCASSWRNGSPSCALSEARCSPSRA